MIILSENQEKAIFEAVRFIHEAQNTCHTFKLAGYAGSGKTTIAKEIKNQSGLLCGACAFTGKAASRLTKKGLEASTIHSLIYQFEPEFKKFKLIHPKDIFIDFFLVDEASMVNEKLWNDLQTFNKPFILVGDPAQLEPVGKDVFLMHQYDFLLTDIFRQGEDSGIIDFATDIREGKPIKKEYKNVSFERPNNGKLLEADIILMYSNNKRVRLNNHMRKLKGFKDLVEVGEKIIIVQNNKDLNIRNGEIYTVKEIILETNQIVQVITHDGKILDLLKEQFGMEKGKCQGNYQNHAWADYGYCITCHKAQGSEWDKVIVYDCGDACFVDKARWRYTAVTRSCKELIYAW